MTTTPEPLPRAYVRRDGTITIGGIQMPDCIAERLAVQYPASTDEPIRLTLAFDVAGVDYDNPDTHDRITFTQRRARPPRPIGDRWC